MSNLPNFTLQFNRIARRHRYVTNKTENIIKDLVNEAETPLGDKNLSVVYSIPCKCKKYGYVGETQRKWETRKGEHKDKVRLTLADMEAGKEEIAERRMNSVDGGLARHALTCEGDINWEEAKIIGRERRWNQRKLLEEIESLRQMDQGITPLNSYTQQEEWQS